MQYPMQIMPVGEELFATCPSGRAQGQLVRTGSGFKCRLARVVLVGSLFADRLKLRVNGCSEPFWPSGKALQVGKQRASARFRFGPLFSSKRLWFVDTVL